jgi:hypothetical protein
MAGSVSGEAGGLAQIASALGLCGFVTPYAIGWLRDHSTLGGMPAAVWLSICLAKASY